MNPLAELRALIAKQSVTETVKVVTANTKNVTVIGRNGLQQVQNNGSIYVQDDVLIIRGSVILGRAPKEINLTEYHL